MVEYFKLDKILTQGTIYTLPHDRFYVIKKIGTDATSDVWLKIDGVDTGAFISDVAPLHVTSDNKLGPLDLGSLYYVVPNDKKFWVEGASGAKVRIIGLIGKLAPGEVIPPSYAGRFADQGKHYITYLKDTATLAAAGADWAADAENEVISLTPKTTETYVLNSILMGKVENSASAIVEGQVGIRIYLDGTPLDILTSDPGMKGIDLLSAPYPPADSTEETAFLLKDLPVTVNGDHTLSLRVINVSGAAITASSSADMTATLAALVEYLKK